MIAIRADLLDFTATPSWQSTAMDGVRFRPDHWLLVGDDGRIVGAQVQDPGPQWQRHDHRGKLLMPGFIDTHVHCPQLDVLASHGAGLLDWLETYTFPAELRYADAAVAQTGAARFLDALLAHGTTAAVVFPTVHKVSVEALFAAGAQRGMRIVAGKVLMDRHAPAGLLDDVVGAERDCEELIARWHGQGRASYAVTVRFAATSTPAQLAMAGELCRRHAGLFMQTHVAENLDEVRWVAELFPQPAVISTFTTSTVCCMNAPSWRTASGWMPTTGHCCATPVRRSRSAPPATPSSAAACSTGRPPSTVATA